MKFTAPEMDVVKFDSTDILTASDNIWDEQSVTTFFGIAPPEGFPLD